MNREINPQDVERLIREGKLRVGTPIEGNKYDDKWPNGKFSGFSASREIIEISTDCGSFDCKKARFPNPDFGGTVL